MTSEGENAENRIRDGYATARQVMNGASLSVRATPATTFCDADILQPAGGQGIASAGFSHRSFQIVFEQESGSSTNVSRVIEMMLINVRDPYLTRNPGTYVRLHLRRPSSGVENGDGIRSRVRTGTGGED